MASPETANKQGPNFIDKLKDRKPGWFLKEVTLETAKGEGMPVLCETLQENTLNVLARLSKIPPTKILLTGENGSGKHTLVQNLASALIAARRELDNKNQSEELKKYIAYFRQHFPGLKATKLFSIDTKGLAKAFENGEVGWIGDELAKNKDAIYVLDLTGVSPKQLEIIAQANWKAPIIAISPDRAGSALLADHWESYQLKPYSPDEVNQIAHHHLQKIVKQYGFNAAAENGVVDLLTRYAVNIEHKSQPGASVELLRLAAAEVSLTNGNLLGKEQLAKIMARQGSVAADVLLQDDRSKLVKVKRLLEERIIGHDVPKQLVIRALERRAAQLSDDRRPIGSFIFLGPTGVGKTEFARVIAEALFGSKNQMIRIDMSEYQEPHTVARLIGSPPGYVGYDAGGQLTEAVARKPFSVVLFDEFEKAHPDVFNTFLQILDDGRLTDGKGKTVDFTQTFIIMTSNFGSDYFYEAMEKHETDLKDEIQQVITDFKRTMRPELINRFDDILAFSPLNKDQLAAVLRLCLKIRIQDQIKNEREVDITVSPAVEDFLLAKGYNPKLGARPLNRAIDTYLLDPLSHMIIDESLTKGDKLQAVLENGAIVIKKI